MTPGRAHSETPRGTGAHMLVLDGVRGVAILMVLCVHSSATRRLTRRWRGDGKARQLRHLGRGLVLRAVRLLDHRPLYDSKKAPRYFRDFYVRRTLRIFPLYYAVLALLFVVLPAVPVPYPAALAESAHHQAWLWLYASNVYLAIHRAWALPYVGHFWSLAVEEQFYLIWPIVVLSFGRRSLLGICIVVTVLALALRSVLSFAGAGDVALVVLTPCRFDALCVGVSSRSRCGPWGSSASLGPRGFCSARFSA